MHKQPVGITPETAAAVLDLESRLRAHHARAETLRALLETAVIAGVFDLPYDPERVGDSEASRAGLMIDLFMDLVGQLADDADKLARHWPCLHRAKSRGEFGSGGGEATGGDEMREAA